MAGTQRPWQGAGLVKSGGVAEARPPRTLRAVVRLSIFTLRRMGIH